MKIRHEINMLDRARTGVVGDLEELAYFDPSKFTATGTHYFEVVVAYTGGTSQVILHDSDHNVHATIVIETTGITRFRSECSAALTADTYHIYMGSSQFTVYAARIIIIQDTSINDLTDCESQFEVGDKIADVWSATPTVSPLAYPKYWYYDSAKWDGTITVYAEVCWEVIDDMDWVSVHLEEDDGSFGNWATAVTIVNQGASEDPVLTRSASFTLTTGRNYRIGIETEGDKAGEGITIYNAKVIIQQEYIPAIKQDSDITAENILGGNGVNDNEAHGQSFTTIGAISVDKIRVVMTKVGAPTDNAYIEIAESISGVVIANGTSANIACSGLTETDTWYSFTFSTPPNLLATTKYYFRVLRSGNYDSSNYIRVRKVNVDLYADGEFYSKDVGVWAVGGGDMTFRVYDHGVECLTKLEPQMLLVNTGKSATGLQDYDQLWDDDEWDGVDLNKYPEHDASQSASNTKIQEDPNGTPSDVSNSSITGANRVRGATALTITDDETIDTNIVAI